MHVSYCSLCVFFDVMHLWQERLGCVKGCKFVDEVVSGVPYIMNDEYLKWVIQEYNIDYVVHGDDPCIVDGKDVYESARKMGNSMRDIDNHRHSLSCPYRQVSHDPPHGRHLHH